MSTRVYRALCFYAGSQISRYEAQISSYKAHIPITGLRLAPLLDLNRRQTHRDNFGFVN